MNMGMCNSSYMEHELLESGFTANIASGETYDLLITATDKRSEYLNYIKKGKMDFLHFVSKFMNLLK